MKHLSGWYGYHTWIRDRSIPREDILGNQWYSPRHVIQVERSDTRKNQRKTSRLSLTSTFQDIKIYQDIERLTRWFNANYLQVNATKTQAMTLGKSHYPYNLYTGDKSIEIESTLKILGVTLDQDLSFKPHVAIMLKKAHAKIAALRRIKRLVPSDVMISLYKAYVLPHLEYCCPLFLGISKVLKNNIERINH